MTLKEIDLDSDDKDVGKLLKRERDAVFLEIPPLRKLSVCQLMTHERSPQLYLFLNDQLIDKIGSYQLS